MNWHLEGSNDKVNWVILDRRIYLNSNTGVSAEAELEDEQKLLR